MMNTNPFLAPGSLSLMNRAPNCFFSLAPSSDSEVVAASALTKLLSAPPSPTPSLLRTKPVSQEFKLPQRFTKNGRKRAVPFPLKLMQVLSDKQYSHVITWMPNGRSFVIIRPTAFVSDVLPKHFKSAQYASFTRKLARWGFSRCEDGTGEFYHPQFRKGRLDLAEKMACGNAKGSQSSMAIHKANEAPSSSENKFSEAGSDSDEHSIEEQVTATTKVQGNLSKQQALAIELEMLRFEQSIRAAAASRKALAGMQQNKLGMVRGTSRALSIISGLPELPWGGLHASLGYPALPSHLMTQQRLHPLVQRRAIIHGAKTA